LLLNCRGIQDKVDEADKSKAEDCFAAVNKAYKMLEDPVRSAPARH
jgi:DnaJ-class molecular chaperone